MSKKDKKNNAEKSCLSVQISWYPGHMAKTKRQIAEDIRMVDIVIEMLDARIPISSENPDIKRIIQEKNKIIILNKSDLADEQTNKQWIEYYKKQSIPAILTNAEQGKGIKEVIACIKEIGSEKTKQNAAKGRVGSSIKVMVLGIPNVGKSSLINRLIHKNSAQVGNKPGVTKQKQWLRIDNGIELLDTPGVLWPKFQNAQIALHLAITGTIKEENFEKTEIAYELLKWLLENYMENVIQRYNLDVKKVKEVLDNGQQPMNENIMEILYMIGKNRGAILSGGRIDEEKTANMILNDFKTAKLGKISLEKP